MSQITNERSNDGIQQDTFSYFENSSSEIWYKGNKPIKQRASFCIPNTKPNSLFFKIEGN